MSSESYQPIVALLFGLVIGSFINVIIYRLPRGRSIVGGRSKCPSCNTVISWYDNIPVVSYVFLRARCRHCSARISARYPVVEIITGVVAALTVRHYGPTLQSAWVFAFLSILLAITLIDWSHRIIPDVLSLGGIVLGWIGSLVCLDTTLTESLLGTVVGGGVLFAIAFLYKAVRRVEGMGGGDIKLMAMIGAFLGWGMVFPVLILASLIGAGYGVYLLKRGATTQTAVAFGSFLAPSGAVMFLFGANIWQQYLRFILG